MRGRTAARRSVVGGRSQEGADGRAASGGGRTIDGSDEGTQATYPATQGAPTPPHGSGRAARGAPLDVCAITLPMW